MSARSVSMILPQTLHDSFVSGREKVVAHLWHRNPPNVVMVMKPYMPTQKQGPHRNEMNDFVAVVVGRLGDNVPGLNAHVHLLV